MRRLAGLGALWFAAVVFATAAELVLGRSASLREVIWADLFLPITAVVGGVVLFGKSHLAFVGFLFWPIWLFLAWRWLAKRPGVALGVALEMWMLLSFAQPVSRLDMLMSG